MRLQHILFILRHGGIIAHATETCYGFACDIFNKRALRHLYQIKKMSRKKPVSIMVSTLSMAKKYGIFNKIAVKLAKKCWPGPFTIIVKQKKTLPPFLNPGTKTIGIRFPAHKLSRELIQKFGSPLTTTSANISGQPSSYSASAIQKQFRGKKLKPDFIFNGGRLKKNPPSTIIDVSKKTPKIIRTGSYNPVEKIFLKEPYKRFRKKRDYNASAKNAQRN